MNLIYIYIKACIKCNFQLYFCILTENKHGVYLGRHDVAIFILNNLITFDNYIQKVSLPDEGVYCPTFKNEMIVAGWGLDGRKRVDVLWRVAQACLPPQKCRYKEIQYHYIENFDALLYQYVSVFGAIR